MRLGRKELETTAHTAAASDARTDAADDMTSAAVTAAEDRPTQKEPPAQPSKKRPSGKRPPAKTTGRMLRDLLIKLGVIALIVWLLLTFVISITIHYGNNMHPAVEDGDFIVSFRMQRPYLNAAVVYRHDGKKCIGRVVALGGNDVAISDLGEISVNGVIPSEEVFYATYRAENADITYPYHVEDGKAFILNDFRSDTNDSRSFGAVDLDDIDGPILFSMRRRGF